MMTIMMGLDVVATDDASYIVVVNDDNDDDGDDSCFCSVLWCYCL